MFNIYLQDRSYLEDHDKLVYAMYMREGQDARDGCPVDRYRPAPANERVYPAIKAHKQTGNVLSDCVRLFGIEREDLTGSHRKRHKVRARQLAMCILRAHGGIALSEVGKLFNKEHTTVIHAQRVISNEIRVYGSFMAEINQIRELRFNAEPINDREQMAKFYGPIEKTSKK